MIEIAFTMAIENGGLNELDFEREEGVSYNPRPARVGLILLHDGLEREVDVLAAGILAASEFSSMQSAQVDFPEHVHALAMHAKKPPAEIQTHPNPPAVKIALALHLDRARHRHQANTDAVISRNAEFLNITAQYLELASQTQSSLEKPLRHWYERFGPNLLAKGGKSGIATQSAK